MLVRNNLETGAAAYAKQTLAVNDKKDALPKQNAQETNQAAEPSKAAELTLSNRIKQIAEENIQSSESGIMDVFKAEEMIRQANQNILNQADDAVKVQSRQTAAVAIELLK